MPKIVVPNPAITIASQLARGISTRGCAFVAINGPPGCGSPEAMVQLPARLPALVESTRSGAVHTVGPLEPTDLKDVGTKLCAALFDQGLIDELPPEEFTSGLDQTIRWVAEHAAARRAVLLLLIDTSALHDTDESRFQLLCEVYDLAQSWEDRTLFPAIAIAGSWTESALRIYANACGASFPYGRESNYVHIVGLPDAYLIEHLRQKTVQLSTLHARAIHELTAGHLAAALDVLQAAASQGRIDVETILGAIPTAALEGPAATHLLSAWRAIPSRSKELLESLCDRRWASANVHPTILEPLHSLGAIRVEENAGTPLITFFSWYVEMLIRLRGEEIGLDRRPAKMKLLREMMPELLCMNEEAYNVLAETEFLLRNYVVVRFASGWESDSHFLEQFTSGREILRKAADWRERRSRKNSLASINPLIAHSLLSDLANLIVEASLASGLTGWQWISQAVKDVIELRNAIMHVQVIGEKDLERLRALKLTVIEALGTAPIE